MAEAPGVPAGWELRLELARPGAPAIALAGGPLPAAESACELVASDGELEIVLRIGAARDGTGEREGELVARRTARPAGAGGGGDVTGRRGGAVAVGVRVELRLGPCEQPGWLIPGLFYGENRAADCARLFPRFTPHSPDLARFESDHWSFRADRAALPAVFAWDLAAGAALVVGERTGFGLSGVGFAWLEGRPALRLELPYREQPVSYDGSERPGPAETAYVELAPGDEVRAELSMFVFGRDRQAYASVLRQACPARHGAAAAATAGGATAGGADVSASAVAWVGLEEAAGLAAHGLYRWHYRPDPPVLIETAAFDRDGVGAAGDRQAMHVSWVSGTPYAHALLGHGRRVGETCYVEAATAVLDNVAAHLAPGGTYWGEWSEARGWGIGWTAQPGRLHARTLADAALFQLRAWSAERRLGVEHPAWEAAVRSNLGVACAGQRGDGALAAALDAGSGEPLDWRGSAGLAWVAPLAEAAAALDEPGYLEAARRAGAHFAADVEGDYLCGAPEDVDLAPTSEDGYLATMSYVALWRATAGAGRQRWLELARRAAEWTLSFRYAYDVDFSPRTLLGHYGFRTRGADQASPANQHLHAFGLICLPEMTELAAALGDDWLLARSVENLACFRQFIAREDGDFGAWRGMAAERYYQTACFQAKGMLGTLSHAWSVGVLLYACEEAIAGRCPGVEP